MTENEPKEQISSPIHSRPPRSMSSTTRYVLGVLTVVALAVGYYFAVALPAQNTERLKLERDKFEAAQQRDKEERERKEQTARETKAAADAEGQRQANIRLDCDQEADAAYWKHIKLNTNEEARGRYTGPARVFDGTPYSTFLVLTWG